MKTRKTPPPAHYRQFKKLFPAVVEAYEQLGKACHWNGPLSPKERELIKIGIALGAGLESATPASPSTRAPRRKRSATRRCSRQPRSAFRA
jgi:alkylhydroperoxidase/carboxymuconolactone decarboxylase family protein YurZ